MTAVRRFLRKRDVLNLIGISNTTLHEWVKAKSFPAPIKLSDDGRAVAWLEDSIIEWQEQRIAASVAHVGGLINRGG